jgi:hypothetical protein
VILATRVSGVSSDGGQLEPMVDQTQQTLDRLGISDPIEQVLADTGYWHNTQVADLKRRGLQMLVPPHPRAQRAAVAAAMQHDLITPDGQRDYRRRQQIIEPVFARTKHHRAITRVLRRGRAAVQAEIDLIATTHNLLKLQTALQTG